MCDTRTWVFKLFIVFLIIHNSRIQHCRAASVSGPVAAPVDGAPADVGASPEDDDSFEATPPEEDTLPGSQRSAVNSTTHDNQRSNAFHSSPGSSSFDAADGYEAPIFGGDDDRSDEDQVNGRQRKFDEAAVRDRNQPGESNAVPVYGVLRRVEEDGDYEEDELSTLPPSPTVSTTTTTSVPWNGGTSDDDDEDVDEILQPMVLPTDVRPYSAHNDGRAMRPGPSYTMEHRATGDGDGEGDVQSRPSNSKDSLVTNHMRPVYTSAFEQHKAHIRNSKGYGHKSHKKKYKDFLHYMPPTRPPLKATTMLTPLQRGILSRDKIFTSDDLPRYYQGQVNYYMSNDDDRNEEKEPRSNGNRHKHHHQHQSGGHLRSGGRYRHIGVQPKPHFPYNPTYPESNIMNYHHLGALAKQQHQLDLERRYSAKEINEYSQHYHKYPHLTELEDQVLQQEQEEMLNAQGDGMFSSQGELVLAADDSDGAFDKDLEEDPNLPPYIKKYQRRNKQLLELLEGTQPPSTPLPPAQWSSSVLKPGPIDGNSHHRSSPQRHHLRSHRKHHHNHQLRNRQRLHRHKSPKWQIEDLFEEQRANPNNPNRTTTTDSEMIIPVPAVILGSGSTSSSTTTTTTTIRPSTSTLSPFDELLKHDSEHLALLQNNQLPAEDVSISGELYDWAIEVGGDDDDNDNADSYIELNRSGPNAWNPKPAISSTTLRPGLSARNTNVYGSIIKSPTSAAATSTAKPITSFAYHRVVEAPRVVGAGQTGRKQRLPFVAITDRRLETSKKGGYNAGPLARKDSEQNHFPMP